MKIVHWRTSLSDKAINAGLDGTGGVVQLYRRQLVSVTGLFEQAAKEVAADYSWEWVPEDAGQKIGLSSYGRTHDRVILRKYDDGWRIATASTAQ